MAAGFDLFCEWKNDELNLEMGEESKVFVENQDSKRERA